jgi:Tetratricopeptide repeat
MGNAERVDVFISYTGRDWGWASWLDFTPREGGYTTPALLLRATNRLSEAEPLCRRAVGILESSLGPDHPNTLTVRKNLELLLAEQGKAKS